MKLLRVECTSLDCRRPEGALLDLRHFIGTTGTREETCTYCRNVKGKHQLHSEVLGMSLTLVNVESDGNCLFRSIGDQVYGEQARHDSVREEICTYIQLNEAYFADYVYGAYGEDYESFGEYILNMRQDGTWGGMVEIIAASLLYRQPVRVLYETFSLTIDPSERPPHETPISLNIPAPGPDHTHIWLAHRPGHYMAVRRRGERVEDTYLVPHHLDRSEDARAWVLSNTHRYSSAEPDPTSSAHSSPSPTTEHTSCAPLHESVRRSDRIPKPTQFFDERYQDPRAKPRGRGGRKTGPGRSKGRCHGQPPQGRCRKTAADGSKFCSDHAPRHARGIKIPKSQFPTVSSVADRRRVHRCFHHAMSEDVIGQLVCLCCGRLTDKKDIIYSFENELPHRQLLAVPPSFLSYLGTNHPDERRSLFEFGATLLNQHFVDPDGMSYHEPSGQMEIQCCKSCWGMLQKGKMPKEALANQTWTGPIPEVLSCLTPAEILCISLSRPTISMFYLRSMNPTEGRDTLQRASQGHWLSFPQHLGALMREVSSDSPYSPPGPTTLPHSPSSIASMVHITLVGPPPYNDLALGKLFSIDPQKIHAAFTWLSTHNILYRDIGWDAVTASLYDGSIPTEIERTYIEEAEKESEERGGYVPVDVDGDIIAEDDEVGGAEAVIASSGVVDIHGQGPDFEARRAAGMENLLHPGGRGQDEEDGNVGEPMEGIQPEPRPRTVVQSRSAIPDWIRDPKTLPSAFPLLFPYGVGGFNRESEYVVDADGNEVPSPHMSLRTHAALLLLRNGQHFAKHEHFLFYALDAIQKQEVAALTAIRFRTPSAHILADEINSISTEELRSIAGADDSGARTSFSAGLDRLTREVEFVTGSLVGSAQSRANSRKELKAMITNYGLPAYWITINPPDAHSAAVLRFSNDYEIDLDHTDIQDLPDALERRRAVARNPVACARYFDACLTAFGDILVQPDRKGVSVGAFGKSLAWYGCIETQGRGTLHCHILVWTHGQPSPAEMTEMLKDPAFEEWRQELIVKMDGLMKQDFDLEDGEDHEMDEVDSEDETSGDGERQGGRRSRRRDDLHPSLLPFAPVDGSDEEWLRTIERDRKRRGLRCQVHKCTFSCTKKSDNCRYGYPRLCATHTTIDTSTGHIEHRRRHALVNGHNPDILTLIRGNSDFKILYEGDGTLSCVHYMSKYMTKMVAAADRLAALALQQREVDERFNNDVNDSTLNARGFVRRCCNRIGAEAEIPAVAAAYYILFNRDHFTNERFTTLYLASFFSRVRAMEVVENGATDEDPDAYEAMAVTRDIDGGFIRRNQVHDYLYRPELLDDVSLWQFVSRYYLERKTRNPATTSTSGSKKACLSRYDLHPDHPCYATHEIRERQTPEIPRISGRAIPSRHHLDPDRQLNYAKSILILFSPWRTLSDLRRDSDDWLGALGRFDPAPEDQVIIDNLQLLHRVQEQVDKDQEMRRARGFHTVEHGPLERDLGSRPLREGEMEQVEAALAMLDRGGRMEETEDQRHTKEAITVLENCGFLGKDDDSVVDIIPSCTLTGGTSYGFLPDFPNIGPGDANSDAVLKTWKRDLKRRTADILAARQTGGRVDRRVIIGASEGESLPSRSEHPGPDVPIHSQQQAGLSGNLNPFDFARRHTLNREQLYAFLLMVLATLKRARTDPRDRYEPYIALIHGPGGTGKSQCLKAFSAWLAAYGRAATLRRAAPTATAAAAIDGQTIHSLFGLQVRGRNRAAVSGEEDDIAIDITDDVSASVRKQWDGVQTVVIDEVSMVGHKMLESMFRRCGKLSQLGSGEPFGGFNMFFFGDMRQFQPVGDRALYREPPGPRQAGADWMPINRFRTNITHVINLHRPMRQSAGEEAFSALLKRLRRGSPTEDDYHLLCTRVLGPDGPDIRGWKDPLVIITRHSLRREVNIRKAKEFARARNQPCYLIPAVYTSRTLGDPTPAQLDYLRNLSPTAHDNLESTVLLTLGMPVVVYSNVSTEQKITNGSYGTLVGMRFARVDGGGHDRYNPRTGVYVLQRPPDMLFVLMRNPSPDLVTHPNLPPGVVIVTPRKATVMARVTGQPDEKFTAWQVNLSGAFAITDYRAQGESADFVICDFRPPEKKFKDGASPYVQASRARRLGGLAILRDFSLEDITPPPNDELEEELARLGEMIDGSIEDVEQSLRVEGLWTQYEAYIQELGGDDDDE